MVQETSPSGNTLSKPLVAAVKQLLRPLVRLLIAKGVGLPVLTGLLKEVYVSVAISDFPAKGHKQTDSRINVLTGVHRKDVKRLRAAKADDFQAPKSVGLGAQVVARWLSGPDTIDADGRPLALPRQPEKSGGPSFDGLVEAISKDVRPRAVLEEWTRLGVARLDKNGRVVLNRLAFVPEKGFEEKAFYLGRNVHDHLAAAAQNLLKDGNPLLERSVHYTGLRPESVATLTEAAERTGMQTLLTLNRMALDLAARDKDHPEATHRINFGLYFYRGATTLTGSDNSDSSE